MPVLTDSEDLYAQATQNIVQEYGKNFDWPTRVAVMGLTGVQRSKKIVELLELPIDWEEYYDLALKQHQTLMQNTQFMPGRLVICFCRFFLQIRRVLIRVYLK